MIFLSSSPAIPWKTPSVPPLLLGLTHFTKLLRYFSVIERGWSKTGRREEKKFKNKKMILEY